MAEYKNENFSRSSLDFIVDGDVFTDCNCAQTQVVAVAGAILVHGGNWLNVDCPNAAIFDPDQNMKMDYCYWLHGPGSDDPMDLPSEPEVCRHVDATNEVKKDGAAVGGLIEYIRSDKEI